MAETTYAEVEQLFLQAEASGDSALADAYNDELNNWDANTASEQKAELGNGTTGDQMAAPSEEFEQRFADKAVEALGFDRGEWADSNYELANGIQRGFTNIGHGAQELGARIMGVNEDRLDELNGRFNRQQQQYDARFGDSGWATGGELLGEVVATAPLGGAAAMGVKAAGMSARAGLLTGSAAEGFGAEFVAQRGDIGDRTLAGTGGAVAGVVGASALDSGAKYVRGKIGNSRARAETAEQLRYTQDNDVAPASGDARGFTNEGTDRVVQAKQDGGYELDRIDAERTPTGVSERTQLGETASEEAALLAKRQDAQIEARAQEFAPEYRRGADGQRPSAAVLREDAGEELAGAVSGVRTRDQQAVTDAYNTLDAKLGDSPIPTETLRADVEKMLDDRDLFPIGDDGTISQVRKLLDEYLPPAKKGVETTKLNALGDTVRGTTIPSPAKTHLTTREARQFKRQITSLYKEGVGAKASNNSLEKLKYLIDDITLDGAARVGDSTVGESIDVVRKARDNFAKWNDKGIKGKISRLGIDPESFNRDPVTTINAMLGKQGLADLKELKRLADSEPTVAAAFKKASDTPMLEALEAATKVDGKFDTAAFAKSLKNISPEKRKILFGDKTAAELEKAQRAWKLRGVDSVDVGLGEGASDVAEAATRGATLAGLKVAGIPLHFAAPVLQFVKSVFGSTQNKATIRALQVGSMTPRARKVAMDKLKAEMLESVGGGSLGQYDSLFTRLINSTVRESATDTMGTGSAEQSSVEQRSSAFKAGGGG